MLTWGMGERRGLLTTVGDAINRDSMREWDSNVSPLLRRQIQGPNPMHFWSFPSAKTLNIFRGLRSEVQLEMEIIKFSSGNLLSCSGFLCSNWELPLLLYPHPVFPYLDHFCPIIVTRTALVQFTFPSPFLSFLPQDTYSHGNYFTQNYAIVGENYNSHKSMKARKGGRQEWRLSSLFSRLE